MTPDFQYRLARVQRLIETIEASDDESLRDTARQLLATVLQLHTEGVKRMVELVALREATKHVDGNAMDAWLGDDLVRHLLALHSLHPVPIRDRVESALERVRPRLLSHGGDVAIVEIEGENVARLRVSGATACLPALRALIEESVNVDAPDVAAIVYEGVQEDEVTTDGNGTHLNVLNS